MIIMINQRLLHMICYGIISKYIDSYFDINNINKWINERLITNKTSNNF